MWTAPATPSAGESSDTREDLAKCLHFSFDGCSNYCVGQARAIARPAVVIPEHRVNPAQVISALSSIT